MNSANQLLQSLSTKDKHNLAKILPNTWVTLDIESTGLSPKTDQIIEVGAVTFTGNKLVDQFSSYVNPHRTISPFISNLTGIKQTNLDNAPDFSAIKQSFIDFVGTNTVIGHNIQFDLNFLSRFFIFIHRRTRTEKIFITVNIVYSSNRWPVFV